MQVGLGCQIDVHFVDATEGRAWWGVVEFLPTCYIRDKERKVQLEEHVVHRSLRLHAGTGRTSGVHLGGCVFKHSEGMFA